MFRACAITSGNGGVGKTPFTNNPGYHALFSTMRPAILTPISSRAFRGIVVRMTDVEYKMGTGKPTQAGFVDRLPCAVFR